MSSGNRQTYFGRFTDITGAERYPFLAPLTRLVIGVSLIGMSLAGTRPGIGRIGELDGFDRRSWGSKIGVDTNPESMAPFIDARRYLLWE